MQAIRTALGQYIYEAEEVDAEVARLNAEIARLRNDIQELTCGDPRKVCPNCRGGEHG